MSALLTWLLLGLGGFCALSGALGIFRMPDFYSRLHPASTGDTLGQLLIIGGLMMGSDGLQTTLKLAVIAVLLFITTPTATHAISQAAYLSGLSCREEGEDDD